MVDNPFIPRNVNNALIYHDDNRYTRHHGVNNHNVELIDTEERHIHAVPINDLRNNAGNDYIAPYSALITGPNQLVTMEAKGNANTVGQKIAARNCKIPVLQLVVYGYCTKLSQTLIVCTSLERAFIRRLSDMDNGYWRNLI
ncbi:hypothetical protein G6F29_014266 [Rhizopus arrhizus]|nr:hypothetical protein G6F29_014266 [Rhizopus arrhizus]KAG1013631.1 hypothetical protein G6F25_014311 [Rhizopus arrhizus]KAG1079122.1 hypothetical protein G6F39_014296 [Rhizopus arrhizus]